jgi:type IV pilus assembly protein PilC
MAVFAYKGRAGGRIVADEIEADSRPAAVAALRAKGIVATAVREKQGKVAAATPAATLGKKLGGKVKDKQLAIYTRQFSTMVNAGLPILKALSILEQQTESSLLAKALSDRREMRKHVRVYWKTLRCLAESSSSGTKTISTPSAF